MGTCLERLIAASVLINSALAVFSLFASLCIVELIAKRRGEAAIINALCIVFSQAFIIWLTYISEKVRLRLLRESEPDPA